MAEPSLESITKQMTEEDLLILGECLLEEGKATLAKGEAYLAAAEARRPTAKDA